MNVYFISGLGADKRAFKNIILPEGYEPCYLDWISPLANETLSHYAGRLATSIDSESDFILIGLSMGGMIAIEIAKIVNPKKVIIISSLTTSDELPWYFKASGKLRLQKLLPRPLYKQARLLNFMMGAETVEVKSIVRSFLQSADLSFIKWSLNAILNWKSKAKIKNLVHIHGTKDRILPHYYTRTDYLIEGGHLIVLDKGEEINKILQKILSEP